jgi:predicted lysophospholipase L1 biosynthesis ABC-type transport system permease subunit
MLPSPEGQKLNAFRQKLMEHNSVTDITFGAGPPQSVYGLRYGTTFRLPHQPEDEGQECEMKAGDQHYVPFFGLELVAGKNFTSAKDVFDEFIVNEKLVKAMGWEPGEAIGRRLRMSEGEATIVGVMKDFHNSSLQDKITPCILVNWASFRECTFVKIESQAGISNSLAHIEKVWKDFWPTGVYKYDFVDDLIEKNYAVEKLTFLGFTTFAVIAVLIGCLGLFGLMSFMTIRKTKEVGIRKVLGATVAQIVALFSKEFVLLVTIAFCMAAPVVYYIMERWLSNFTYRVPLSWWIFAAGGMLALFIAMISVSYQSVRAAMANPVESLKNE